MKQKNRSMSTRPTGGLNIIVPTKTFHLDVIYILKKLKIALDHSNIYFLEFQISGKLRLLR